MYKHLVYTAVILFVSAGFLFSQDSLSTAKKDSLKINALEARIKALEEQNQASELEKLLQDAENTSNKKEENKKTKTFKSGQRALQSINPEISVVGDAFGKYDVQGNTTGNRVGANFRVLGIHIQGNLDPFSMAKATIEFTPEGVELGEAYLTWTNFLSNVSLTAGKFRQQFGVLNRWHKHSLDQFDYPLPVKTIFGEDGLNQIGLSFNWLMPSIIGDANNLTIEITNGQNNNLFAGETFSFPATLLHFKNYWDLSRNTYLELGLTGMYGKNHVVISDDLPEQSFNTWVGGADLTLFWEPVNKALYKSLLWRSEVFYANKEISTNSAIKTFGAYTYLEYKFAEQWEIGTRLDYSQPFEEKNDSKYTYQIVPYITWWQSHWVKLRLQYNYVAGNLPSEGTGIVRLQMIWAMGPHKHDRY